MYKPAGHNSLSPYLIVSDARPVLDFIKAVFGVEPTLEHRDDSGALSHVEFKIDDTILMLGQAPGTTSQAHIHVYVPDVDQSFELAKAAGGKVVQEPMQKADPDRRCGIADPSGTTWWLATTQGFNNA